MANLHHRPDWTSSHHRNTPEHTCFQKALTEQECSPECVWDILWGPKVDLKGKREHQHPSRPPECRCTVISSLVCPLPWWTDRTLKLGGKWSPFLTDAIFLSHAYHRLTSVRSSMHMPQVPGEIQLPYYLNIIGTINYLKPECPPLSLKRPEKADLL